MSANRKYTQLKATDLDLLLSVFKNNRGNSPNEDRIAIALHELVGIAKAAKPGSSICLAYAVKRGSK